LVVYIIYINDARSVKQISDNEIYLLIKYIKSVLWRVAKRLSHIQDARCLKVKVTIYKKNKYQSYHDAFKHTDIRIAFRTANTIQNLLEHKDPFPGKFLSSGVYTLTCPDCNKAYVGQTGRRFSINYNEHRIAFHNNSQSPSLHNTS